MNMKKLIVPFKVIFYIMVIMFISSCSMLKNDDFSLQKYSNIKKVEASAYINRVSKENKSKDQLCVVPEKKTETVNIPADEPCQAIATILPEAKHNTGKTIR